MYTVMVRNPDDGPNAPSTAYATVRTQEEVMAMLKKARDEGLIAQSFPPLDEALA